MLDATTSYRIAASNLTRSLTQTARDPVVKRETEYFLATIGSVKSAKDLTSNRRLLNYALKAHGLEEMSYAGAFVRKVLEGGVESSSSLANRLADSRYRNFVEAFNFERYGEFATTFASAKQETVDLYTRQTLEANVGNNNEGARLALYFARKAPALTSTLGLLADKALLKVTQTALQMPASTVNLSLDQQVALIERKLKVADLQDPAKLSKFLTRFTSLYDLSNPTASSSFASSLFAGSSSSVGIGTDILSAIQSLSRR